MTAACPTCGIPTCGHRVLHNCAGANTSTPSADLATDAVSKSCGLTRTSFCPNDLIRH